MADNGTAASGPTIAWDDIGGVAYQRIKNTWGADGTATDVSDAAPMPVSTRTPGDIITVTPTVDTAAYASGDTLFAATVITNAVRAVGERAILQSLTVIDKDDLSTEFKLYFFSATVTFGTINAVPSISDTDAANFLGSVSVESAHYDDLGGNRVASLKGIGLMLEADVASRDLYVAATTTSAHTRTASGLVLKFGLLWT